MLKRCVDFSIMLGEAACERYRLDWLWTGDDVAAQRSMMMSPQCWRELIRPHMARALAVGKRRGLWTAYHCCGAIRPIIPDLIDVGVNMLQPIQPEAMNIFELKREFGRDLCLVGGISTQKTLPFGTPQQVRDEVKTCLDVMAEGGGYIMAPAKAILPGVPVENAVALLESFVNQTR